MQRTLTGSILGPPYYLSPEQINGDNIGTHTDQYALALIAAEMLTGKTIRAGKTFNQIITSDIYEPITINHIEKKDLPKNIINALNKATQPNISSRFKNISELENELLAHQTPTSLNIPTINVSIPTHKKKSSKIIAIVLILILLASITLLVKSFYKKNGNIEMQEYKLPPDINFLLGYSQNFLIAKGLENLYAIDINNLQNEPFKLYFKNDEIFISFLPNSDLLFAKNNSLWIRHYFLEQNITFEDELFLKELPKYKQIAFSPSAELLAIENETSVEAYRIKNQNLIKIFEFRKPDLQLIKLTISDKYLALIFKNNLKVFDLQQREKILDELIPMGTTCIQVLDLAHIVLIAGWYDEIFIFDLISKNKKSVSFPGQTFFIQYLPDNPTLLISKLEKFIIWDLNKNKEKFILERKGAFFESAILGLNGIYVYEKSTKHLIIIQYNSYKEIKNIKVSSLPIWALSYDKITNKAYAGGQDGILYEINIGTNEITQHKLHTQGITSIIAKDNLLITASDDKTIAVWKIPEMQILYRSQAHEYLINFLYLSPEGGKLWSSSSDGSIKMLNLPSLEKMQEIQIKNYSLQAFWINKEQDFIIAGTWNHRLLYLKKINGNWQLEKEIPLESKVIYSVAYLPNVNLILIAGLIPNILYVYDLEKNYFTEIKETYLAINWIQAISPKEAIGAADNALIYFNFERNPESIIAKIKISINSSLKFPLISEYFKNKSLIITGNIYGEITVSSLYDTLNSIEYTVNIPISNHT
jgi:WD40 repeat protein